MPEPRCRVISWNIYLYFSNLLVWPGTVRHTGAFATARNWLSLCCWLWPLLFTRWLTGGALNDTFHHIKILSRMSCKSWAVVITVWTEVLWNRMTYRYHCGKVISQANYRWISFLNFKFISWVVFRCGYGATRHFIRKEIRRLQAYSNNMFTTQVLMTVESCRMTAEVTTSQMSFSVFFWGKWKFYLWDRKILRPSAPKLARK